MRKTRLDPRHLPAIRATTLGRILGSLTPYRWRVSLVVGCIIGGAILNLTVAVFVRQVVDTAIPARDLPLLWWSCLGMIVGPAAAGLLQVAQKYNAERIGQDVMYDMRVELYRRLHGDLLLVPSAFTYTTGQAHWEVLLRARAIENLAFVAAAAQGGLHDNGRRTWGHSMVVDPWGQVLACQPEGEAVVLADLHHDSRTQRCTQLPALRHRVL